MVGGYSAVKEGTPPKLGLRLGCVITGKGLKWLTVKKFIDIYLGYVTDNLFLYITQNVI